jgi:transposase
MAKQKTRKTPVIETVNAGAAAVDIGSREHMAADNPDTQPHQQWHAVAG